MRKALKMDKADNVATMTSRISKGNMVAVLSSEGEVVQKIQSNENIEGGHKIALQRIQKHEEIVKYGEAIGTASENILTGEWVHTHNVESGRLPTEEWEEDIV